MKVKDIRKYIEKLPDDMDVVVSDGRGYLEETIGIDETITWASLEEPYNNLPVVVIHLDK